MSLMKNSPTHHWYTLPIGFTLIIIMMLAATSYTVTKIKASSNSLIKSVENGNTNHELLSVMSKAALSRSIFIIEMLQTKDAFRKDDIFLDLQNIAKELADARAKFQVQDNNKPIRKLLKTQAQIVKINGPTLEKVYSLVKEGKNEKALALFTNVILPRQKINLTVINDIADQQSWDAQDDIEKAKKSNDQVYSTIFKFNTFAVVLSILLTIIIINRQNKSVKQLALEATTDGLTNLPNRTSLVKAIDAYIKEGPSNPFAVIFFDIDYFKKINDNHGHEIGDEVLRQFSKKIKDAAKKEDIISRFGNDEFVLLLRSIKTKEEAHRFAEKITANLNTFLSIEEHKIFISASVGITVYSNEGEDARVLLKNASTAMNDAKHSGMNCFEVFSQKKNKKRQDEDTMSHDLHSILKNGNPCNELYMMYQPLLNIQEGTTTECEALIRWTNKDGEVIPPDQFIPLAEKSNLIEEVNLFVIDETCKQQKKWQRKGKTLRVNINLCGSKATFKKLLTLFRSNLRDLDLSPSLFGIELTERTIHEITDETIDELDRLRNEGLKISIDDFGTGYSSLSYLKKLPITTLKIDKEFITGLPEDREDQALVNAIITLGHALKLDIVAEGVETKGQLEFLRDNNCNIAQGYYFQRPMASQKIPHLKVVV